MKIVKKNQMKIVFFTAVKNRCILHGRVFVMLCYDFNWLFKCLNPIMVLPVG